MSRSSSHVLLSALADESAFELTAVEQFTAMAAIGLEERVTGWPALHQPSRVGLIKSDQILCKRAPMQTKL